MRMMQPYRLTGLMALVRTLSRRAAAAPLVALLAMGAAACESATGPGAEEINVTVSTDQPSYAPGNEIVISYTNETSAEVGYNLCWAWLERQQNGAWVRIENQPGHVCTAELRTLEPGATATERFPLPETLAAGQYRIRTHIESFVTGGRVVVTTNTFTIGS